MALETFKFYPDIYAILLNEIHLILNPTSDSDQVKQIQKLVDRIYSSMAIQMKNEVQKITLALADERKAYTHELDMFQGTIEEKKRKEYNVINFLVWTE